MYNPIELIIIFDWNGLKATRSRLLGLFGSFRSVLLRFTPADPWSDREYGVRFLDAGIGTGFAKLGNMYLSRMVMKGRLMQ